MYKNVYLLLPYVAVGPNFTEMTVLGATIAAGLQYVNPLNSGHIGGMAKIDKNKGVDRLSE